MIDALDLAEAIESAVIGPTGGDDRMPSDDQIAKRARVFRRALVRLCEELPGDLMVTDIRELLEAIP